MYKKTNPINPIIDINENTNKQPKVVDITKSPIKFFLPSSIPQR